MYKNLSREVEIRKNADIKVGSDTNNVNGTAVDMKGYDGVIFLSYVVAGHANTYLKVQGDDIDGDQGTDLEGTRVNSNARTDIALVCDVYRPAQRYLKPIVVVTTTNSSVSPIFAIRYKARKRPVSNTSDANDGITTVLVASPAAGTP